MKRIIEKYPDYMADDDGNIYSLKWNREHKLTPWLDSQKRYYYVTLSMNNVREKQSVHRLIAETFLDNPNHYTDVDHINKDTHDNRATNLRWCSHQQNLHYSYDTLGPVRNFKVVELQISGQHIGYFQSISLACKYAKTLGYSYSSLQKYRKSGKAILIERDVTTIENAKIIKSLTEVE